MNLWKQSLLKRRNLPMAMFHFSLNKFHQNVTKFIKKENCPKREVNKGYFKHIGLKGQNISKIEKVPRGIRGEKSSKDMASSRNLVSTIGALASPKMGDGTRCPEG